MTGTIMRAVNFFSKLNTATEWITILFFEDDFLLRIELNQDNNIYRQIGTVFGTATTQQLPRQINSNNIQMKVYIWKPVEIKMLVNLTSDYIINFYLFILLKMQLLKEWLSEF